MNRDHRPMERVGRLPPPAKVRLHGPSKTRLSVLVALRVRPMTAVEVARQLRIDKAGAHRHLAALVESGLVEQVRTPRKWVYYRLAPPDSGRGIIKPGPTADLRPSP